MAYCRKCLYLNFITREGIVDCYYYTYGYCSTVYDHKDCDFFIDRDKIAKEVIKENTEESKDE